jgi:hypothetical protein
VPVLCDIISKYFVEGTKISVCEWVLQYIILVFIYIYIHVAVLYKYGTCVHEPEFYVKLTSKVLKCEVLEL